MEEKIYKLIDELVEEKVQYLKTIEGINYLLSKYSSELSVSEIIDKELCSIYDEINSIVYLYITGKIVNLKGYDTVC